MRKVLGLMAAALLVGGCSNVMHRKTEVKEEQVARLPQDQLGEVNDWRQRVTQADEAKTRAQVAVNDAKAQRDVAKKDVDVAKSQIDREKKALETARQMRDQSGIQRAEQDLTRAENNHQIAEARYDLEKENVELMETRHDLASKKADLTRANLEQAEYHALQKANDPAAQRYNQATFDKEIAELQGKISDLQRKESQEVSLVEQKRNTWRQTQQRLQASTPATPRG